MRLLRVVVAAAVLPVVALGPAGPAWAGVRPPPDAAITGTRAGLTAVAAIPGTTDAWAVGEECPKTPEGCLPGNDLVLRESSAGWSPVAAPSPGGQASLAAVSADSASDAWAVGSSDGGEKNLYLHWTGGRWKDVSGPTPDGSVLTGVAAISPTDALAVGYHTSSSGTTVTLALHWDGKTWAQLATPDPSTSYDELLSITAVPGTGAWAVGASLDPQSTYKTLIVHWNGTAWSQASAPGIATFGTQLSGVAAGSASDVWAAGQYYSATGADQPLIMHWNGTAWARAKLPAAGAKTEMLHSVTATSDSSAWAVGLGPCVGPSVNCPSKTLIMHWNGSAWKVISSVSVSDRQDQNVLTGVVATSGSNAWAVGDYFPAVADEPIFAMLQHWNGTRWATQ